MLDSTIELISLAASNSIVVFCFCNFIIGILLVGGAKPPSEFVQDSPIPPPTVDHRNQNGDIEGTTTKCSLNNDDDASTVVSESCAEKAMVDEEKEKEKENEEDDELRRRVEEFIDKINKGWKAEKSRTSLLV